MKYIITFILLLFILTGHAQTSVGGRISRDTTWTKANSPYLAVDLITIDTNITLTLEPGVTILFQPGRYLVAEHGCLKAIGTETDSIHFKSENTTDIWPGAILVNPHMPVEIAYCNFSNADRALHIEATKRMITVDIRKSIFRDNLIALELYDTTGITISIDSTGFDRNNYAVIGYYDIYSFSIYDCKFRDNQTAVSDLRKKSAPGKGDITRCLFSRNKAAIIRPKDINISQCLFRSGVDGVVDSKGGCNFLNCDLDSMENCIYAFNDSVMNCRFRYNLRALVIGKGCYVALNLFEYNSLALSTRPGNRDAYLVTENQIVYNQAAGQISGGTFSKNIVEDNRRGLGLAFHDTAKGLVTCNKLCGSDTMVVLASTIPPFAKEVDITNNYWCSTDSAEIEKIVFHKVDNPYWAKVLFMPVDLTECYKPVSVPEIGKNISQLMIYPNPAGNFITISPIPVAANLDVYSIDGKCVYHSAEISGDQTVNTTHFARGLYFIRVTTPASTGAAGKFVKL